MESETKLTVSLVIPFLFNFSKKLDFGEKFKVTLAVENLCKIYLSYVSRETTQKHVDDVFKIFKAAFAEFKQKYLGSVFYETLAIYTLLGPR